jgi:hypothetical protein
LALAHLHLSFDIYSPMYLPCRLWPNGYTAENTNLKAFKAVEAEWEAFWRAFAHVRVRVLIVEILDYGVRVPEQVLLEPLRQVSEMRVGRFEVVLPWPEGLERSGEFGDAGFVVRRPPEGVDLMMHWDVDKGGQEPWHGRPMWQRLRRR